MIFYPERLSVEITNKCNFSCEICPKQSPNYHDLDSTMDFETFCRLKKVLPYIKALNLSGIGEPLLHPEIEKFISFAKVNMPEDSSVGFQTNGSLLTSEKLKELIKAGLNKICISVDCIMPVKGLHNPEVGIKALDIISSFKSNNTNLKCGVEIVITTDNLEQIIPTLRELKKFKIDFLILSHLIPYRVETSQKVAYETNNEKAIRIFKKWRKTLEKHGYTIQDWLELMKKKALPEFFPEEDKPYSFFKAMYNEAQKNGVTLHIQNLINRNESLLNKTQRILKEVETFCRKNHISAQIPRTNPNSHRKCDFVEEKCIFVGVDGEVSPCYFLWHSFTCYISGLKKSIKKWSFGNIKEKDPLEIYNSVQYRRFVDSVLRYDFPYCYDCNFALCDLMELEEFLYDCYTNDVPCGACLWCGGLFYCMI